MNDEATTNPLDLHSEWEAAETVLERVKHSCFAMHLLYRRKFLDAKRRLSYYDVPIIVFSALNSVLIAGGKDFVPADVLQILTCLLAVIVGIIQALKNFFKIDENRENCLTAYKDLFRLFCEISLLLDQPRHTRGIEPRKYTIDKGNEYQAIMNKGILLEDDRTKRNPIYEDHHPYRPHRSGLSDLFHDMPNSNVPTKRPNASNRNVTTPRRMPLGKRPRSVLGRARTRRPRNPSDTSGDASGTSNDVPTEITPTSDELVVTVEDLAHGPYESASD
jgi:hypothetical protein